MEDTKRAKDGSRRGRPCGTTQKIDWKIRVPVAVAGQVELLLTDPLRGTVEYSARSELITMLLEEWINKQRKGV